MRGFQNIHVFSNALEIIRAINGSLDWTIHSILIDTKEIYVDLDVIIFAHSPKGINGFTHNLAKDSYKIGNFVGWGGF